MGGQSSFFTSSSFISVSSSFVSPSSFPARLECRFRWAIVTGPYLHSCLKNTLLHVQILSSYLKNKTMSVHVYIYIYVYTYTNIHIHHIPMFGSYQKQNHIFFSSPHSSVASARSRRHLLFRLFELLLALFISLPGTDGLPGGLCMCYI